MQTVERAMAVLSVIGAEKAPLGVTEIARSLDLPKSAVHRTLGTLVDTGFVEKDDESSRYCLGPRAIDLGMAAIGNPDIRVAAVPVLEQLTEGTQETTTLSVLVGRHRLYVSQIEAPRTVRMTVKVGVRFPLYAGASGKAILSFLPASRREAYLAGVALEPLTPDTITSREQLEQEIERVREAGYAVSFGERDRWAAAVAAPVVTSHGTVVGSISVCGPRARFGADEIARYGGAVVEAAHLLSEQIV
jgi:DNA-binding IclR family transcriptional regulator